MRLRRLRYSASAPRAVTRLYLQNRGEGGPAKTQEVLQQFLGALNSDPQLGGAQTRWRANVPRLYVDVDRDKAKSLGVPIDDVFNTLSAALAVYRVNDFAAMQVAPARRSWREHRLHRRPDTVGGSGCARRRTR